MSKKATSKSAERLRWQIEYATKVLNTLATSIDSELAAIERAAGLGEEDVIRPLPLVNPARISVSRYQFSSPDAAEKALEVAIAETNKEIEAATAVYARNKEVLAKFIELGKRIGLPESVQKYNARRRRNTSETAQWKLITLPAPPAFDNLIAAARTMIATWRKEIETATAERTKRERERQQEEERIRLAVEQKLADERKQSGNAERLRSYISPAPQVAEVATTGPAASRFELLEVGDDKESL